MLATPPLSDTLFDFDTEIDRRATSSLKWERYADRDVLPFWVADMDFAVAEPVRTALAERLAHPIYGYTVASTGLVDSVIDFLASQHDWHVDPDWLVWLPGVVSGLAVAARACCGDGDEIIVNPPIYHHFYDSHESGRHRLLRVPLMDDGAGRRSWDIDAMRLACSDQTRMMMLCSPQNPTTTVYRTEELRAVMAMAEDKDLVVVSDEIHCDLILSDARHVPIAAAAPELAHRTITLMSASKTWNLAGLNCSFAVIPDPALRERFTAAAQSIVPLVPPLAFVATEAAYRHGNPWRLALLDYVRGNLERISTVLQTLPELELQPLEATYLAWIDARGLNLEDAQEYFESAGIGLSNGEQFGEPSHLRLNFACPRSILDEGLDRLSRAVGSLKR